MHHAHLDRRQFLKTAALGAAALAFCGARAPAAEPAAAPLRLLPPDRKLNIACVGCGGKGNEDVEGVSGENVVALCDVDERNAAHTFKKHPDVKKYKDFRVMFREMGDKIDAVTVTTPDHMHFPIAMAALEMGKHVHVQKPLTHTVVEARLLAEAARKHGAVTQMGNQAHAHEGTRLVREWVQSGLIGAVHEVHIWTDRPIWPQGIPRPPDTPPVPAELAWDLWLGVAPARPYHPGYCPFKWRGWWDFGTGALGDMGCHFFDAPYWALDLTHPTSVEAQSGGNSEETGPNWSILTYQFPARGAMPTVTIKWYDGKRLPPRPPQLEAERKLSDNGQLIVGEKGTILTDGAADSPRLIPESAMKSAKLPPKTIPRVPQGDHYKEWINAIKGGPMCGSNFNHAGPLTEAVLLGNVALRLGKKIEWDPVALRCPNAPEAERLLRKTYRTF